MPMDRSSYFEAGWHCQRHRKERYVKVYKAQRPKTSSNMLPMYSMAVPNLLGILETLGFKHTNVCNQPTSCFLSRFVALQLMFRIPIVGIATMRCSGQVLMYSIQYYKWAFDTSSQLSVRFPLPDPTCIQFGIEISTGIVNNNVVSC